MSYAGDLSPQEAWAKLEAGAILVDVRTEGEWAHIGIPYTSVADGYGDHRCLHQSDRRQRQRCMSDMSILLQLRM